MMSKCRTCGKAVHWGTTDDGKRIILDAVAPVYRLMSDGTAIRAKTGFVSHFATCPDANAWSKNKPLAPTLTGDDLDALFQAAVCFGAEDSPAFNSTLGYRIKSIIDRFAPPPPKPAPPEQA